MTALAVMIALVGAMFTALAPTSAQTTGIVLGSCVAWDATNPTNTMNYVAIGDKCTIPDVVHDTSADDASSNADSTTSSNPAVVAAPMADTDTDDNELTALSVGLTEVAVTTAADATTTYRITVISQPTVIVHIADTDNTVSKLAPAPSVSIIARGFTNDQLPDDGTTISVSTSGIYFDAGTQNTSFASAVTAVDTTPTTVSADDNVTGKTFAVTRSLVVSAASDGEYIISATVAGQDDDDDDATVERKAVSGSAKLIVGDPGASPHSATLVLGDITPDNPTTVVDETQKESGSKPASQAITLVYSISNSLGNPANNTDLTTIQVIAPQGVVTANAGTTIGTESPTAKGSFIVSSASNKARTVNVRLIATGAGGVAESATVTLTFTGGAGSIALGDASGSLLNVNQADDTRDQIAFGFSTADSAGNMVANPQNLSVVITGPDGMAVAVGTPSTSGRIDWAQGDAPGSREGSNNLITLTSNGSSAKPLATGTYTLKINSGALTTSASFVVAARAASVAVSLDNMSPSAFGDLIKATANVTDSDGNPAADGTLVTFDASSSNVQGNVLSRVGVAGAIKTKGGVASATFAAVGSGTAVITAVADGATGVAVVSSTAGATDAGMADEEVTLACLSETSGFSVYGCSMGSTASELFALLSGRGATAIHLWNGSSWVRYSVVDGTTVPGSSDFMVAENDILYISN